MKIEKIRVKNFRSFKELDIDFRDFNTIIGSNASGKSNFVELFKFIQSIAENGLEDAIALQGDIDNLRNRALDEDEFSFEITGSHKMALIYFGDKGEEVGFKHDKFVYQFKIRFHEKETYQIIKDKLIVNGYCWFLKREEDGALIDDKKIGEYELIFESNGTDIDIQINLPEKIKGRKEEVLKEIKFEKRKKDPLNLKKELLIEEPYSHIMIRISSILERIGIFDIDPKNAKKNVPISGITSLEEDGSNLAVVLKNILKKDKSKKKLNILVKSFLPFLRDIETGKSIDKYLLIKVKEIYLRKGYFPASLISDGTINIIALMVILYFEDYDSVFIEEPERNLHPKLISKLISKMYDKSEGTQIFITTHSTEVIRCSKVEDMLFIVRNDQGFSEIKRLIDDKEVVKRIENDFGIEELFIHDEL